MTISESRRDPMGVSLEVETSALCRGKRARVISSIPDKVKRQHGQSRVRRWSWLVGGGKQADKQVGRQADKQTSR